MKIKHFLGSLDPKFGGPTASVPIQCIGAAKCGVNVTLVTYEESRQFESSLIDSGVHIQEYKQSSGIGRLFSKSLYELLRKDDDTDIYHYHGVWRPGCHWIAASARRQNKKYVVNPRGDLEIYRINYNKWKKFKKMLSWHLYAKLDTQNSSCVLTTSQQEADAVRKLGITSPIAIIPNGMDLSVFPSKIHHISQEKKIVLFLSRVNPIKGLELLIESWSQLPVTLRNQWELHIAGNSDPIDYIDKLKSLVNSLKLSDSVKFLGPIIGDAKIVKYQESSLFVLPTYNENFGNVIAEAMMCECPVITTKNAPWSCLIEDKCGWWIDLNVDNLTETLLGAMSLSDEERYELGRKSRQCIINRFSLQSAAEKTLSLYKWILGDAEKPVFVETIP